MPRKKRNKRRQRSHDEGKGGKERRALTGSCPKCGTKMFRILGAK